MNFTKIILWFVDLLRVFVWEFDDVTGNSGIAVEFKLQRGGARAQRDNAGLAGATTQGTRISVVM